MNKKLILVLIALLTLCASVCAAVDRSSISKDTVLSSRSDVYADSVPAVTAEQATTQSTTSREAMDLKNSIETKEPITRLGAEMVSNANVTNLSDIFTGEDDGSITVNGDLFLSPDQTLMVSQGQVTLTTINGSQTVIFSPSTIVNWNSFNIGSGESTVFKLPYGAPASNGSISIDSGSNLSSTIVSGDNFSLINQATGTIVMGGLIGERIVGGPISITSVDGLMAMNPDDPTAVYSIDADIDVTGSGFTSLGTPEHPFQGTIIGNGHTISGLTDVLIGAAGEFSSIGGLSAISSQYGSYSTGGLGGSNLSSTMVSGGNFSLTNQSTGTIVMEGMVGGQIIGGPVVGNVGSTVSVSATEKAVKKDIKKNDAASIRSIKNRQDAQTKSMRKLVTGGSIIDEE